MSLIQLLNFKEVEMGLSKIPQMGVFKMKIAVASGLLFKLYLSRFYKCIIEVVCNIFYLHYQSFQLT